LWRFTLESTCIVTGVVLLRSSVACFCRQCVSLLVSLFGHHTTVPMTICQRGKTWVPLSSQFYLGSLMIHVPYGVAASLQKGVSGQAPQARRPSCRSSLSPFESYLLGSSTLCPVLYNQNKTLYVPNLVLASWPIWSEHCNYCLSVSGRLALNTCIIYTVHIYLINRNGCIFLWSIEVGEGACCQNSL
jgi:hypothetical protein